jgi:preprotein translocase subunit SecE
MMDDGTNINTNTKPRLLFFSSNKEGRKTIFPKVQDYLKQAYACEWVLCEVDAS